MYNGTFGLKSNVIFIPCSDVWDDSRHPNMNHLLLSSLYDILLTDKKKIERQA